MKKLFGAVTLSMLVSSSFISAAIAGPMSDTVNYNSAKMITAIPRPIDGSKPPQNKDTAKPKVSLEEAEKIAKKLIVLPSGFKRESAQFEDRPGRKVWTFRWTQNLNYKFQSIQVSIDADTGELRNFYKEDPSMWESNYDFTSDFTKDEARKIAVQFVKKNNAVKFPFLEEVDVPQYQEYYGSGKRPMMRYSFRFVRQVNDIAFDDDGVWLEVLENGQISNYNLNWTPIPADLPKPAIKLEQAKKIFKEKLGFKLSYVKDYSKQKPGQGEPTDTKLVYQVPEYLNFYIDAQTGEIKDFSGIVVTEDFVASMNSAPQAKTEGKFYVEKNKLAKEDAIKIAEGKITIPEGYENISTEYLPDYYSGRSVWLFRYAKKEADKLSMQLEISVAADNGELMRMNKFRNYPPEPTDKNTKVLSYEETLKAAEAFIENVLPEKAGYVKIDPQPPTYYEDEKIRYSPERWFHFTRYYNGIAVAGEGMGISVDTITGEVINFDQQFTQGKFQAPQNILPVDKIYEKFFNKSGLKLSYFRVYKPGIYYDNLEQANIQIGYRMPQESPRQFNAQTGEPVYNGWEKPKQKNEYTKDIAKHKYEKAIKRLFDLNIMGGRTKEAFYPDKQITKVEFVKALVVAKGLTPIYDSSKLPFKDVSVKAWYAPYVRAALAKGIITPAQKLDPISSLTPEAASIMVVKALGYEKIAKLDIYKKPTGINVKKENSGFAAIAQGLKLLPENDDKVTRGEAAQLIINVLKNNQ